MALNVSKTGHFIMTRTCFVLGLETQGFEYNQRSLISFFKFKN